MIHLSARSLLAMPIALLLSCSSVRADVQAPSIEAEEAFDRTTRCVNGKLPSEIRNSLLGRPTVLSGQVFDVEAIERLSSELDMRIAALLEAAMREAWKLTTAKQRPWSAAFYSTLEAEYAAEVAKAAPKLLRIESCGDSDQVGGAALAAIAGYFSRAVVLEGGGRPKWLEALGAAGHDKGASIVMLAVGLRLAKINFEPEMLAKAAS